MSGAWQELSRWLSGPGGAWLTYSLAGLLGAVVDCTLHGRALLLPRRQGRRLELGFLGHLAACTVVAHLADHSFQTAFVAALCGVAALRALQRRLERVIEEQWEYEQRGGG